jgi:hypothetical protein
LTELTAELDYASVLPQYTPLLLELDRLIAAEQKRFDIVPAQVAFERECLALKLQDLPSDLLEGEFKEIPIAGKADQLPSTAHASAPVQSAIGSAPQPRSIALAAAMSSTMVTPGATPSRPLLVDSRLPDIKDEDSSEVVDGARGQLPSTDETLASDRSTAVSSLAVLQAVTPENGSTSAVAAPEAGALPRDNTDPLSKLSQA